MNVLIILQLFFIVNKYFEINIFYIIFIYFNIILKSPFKTIYYLISNNLTRIIYIYLKDKN